MTWDMTAELATPLVIVGAVAGLVVGRARVWPLQLDPWATGAALFTFAVFAAPIVLGGSASFAGYTILGDTAVHFVLADRIASEGTSLAGLEPSSYRADARGVLQQRVSARRRMPRWPPSGRSPSPTSRGSSSPTWPSSRPRSRSAWSAC